MSASESGHGQGDNFFLFPEKCLLCCFWFSKICLAAALPFTLCIALWDNSVYQHPNQKSYVFGIHAVCFE